MGLVIILGALYPTYKFTNVISDLKDKIYGCLLLCRLLVVGPVLNWLPLCMYLFLRVHSLGHTFGYF